MRKRDSTVAAKLSVIAVLHSNVPTTYRLYIVFLRLRSKLALKFVSHNIRCLINQLYGHSNECNSFWVISEHFTVMSPPRSNHYHNDCNEKEKSSLRLFQTGKAKLILSLVPRRQIERLVCICMREIFLTFQEYRIFFPFTFVTCACALVLLTKKFEY